MAESKTEIWNLAIGHLGTGKEIASDSENSEEAKACRRMWDICLRKTLIAAPWHFAKRIQAAELIEIDPNDEWGYSYQIPTDCVFLRRVLSGSRNDSRQSRIPFTPSSDTDGNKLFYTDLENAYIEITFLNTNPLQYTPGFELSASYKLASLIAPRLTKGDPFKMKKDMERLFLMSLSEASAENANEEQPDVEVESEFIRARE
jgi:hypothetical protein